MVSISLRCRLSCSASGLILGFDLMGGESCPRAPGQEGSLISLPACALSSAQRQFGCLVCKKKKKNQKWYLESGRILLIMATRLSSSKCNTNGGLRMVKIHKFLKLPEKVRDEIYRHSIGAEIYPQFNRNFNINFSTDNPVNSLCLCRGAQRLYHPR